MKHLKDATQYEKQYTYKFYQDNEVQLEHARPVAKGKKRGGSDFTSRVGFEGALPKPIQYYRMWFSFLKLALECEEKDIEVVLKPNSTKRANRTVWHVPRVTTRIKVNRKFYKDWDLDDVLHQTFREWWDNHRHLFEASLPKLVSGETITTDDDHVYLKIDKRTIWEDLIPILTKDLRPRIGQPHRFAVKGKGRYTTFLNRYNAVVCSLNGMSPREICTHPNSYIIDAEAWMDVGQGKMSYSHFFGRQYKGGIKHLLEVSEGRFGEGYHAKLD